MKKIITFLILSIFVAASFTACSNNDKTNSLVEINSGNTESAINSDENSVDDSTTDIISVNSEESSSKEIENNNSSMSDSKELTNEDIIKILENHFGKTDETTGYLNVFDIAPEKQEINGKMFFTGRYSRLVIDHTSLISYIIITEDGTKAYFAELIDSKWIYNESDAIELK